MASIFSVTANVFSSFRARIIFFIALIMITTAALVMYFSNQDVGKAMFIAQEQAAKDVLRFVDLNIQSGYDRLLKDRVETMLQRRHQLKDQALVAQSVLVELAAMADLGKLTPQQARRHATQWLQRMPQGAAELFVFEPDQTIIIHTDTNQIGQSVNHLVDMKGRSIGKAMNTACLDKEGDFAVFAGLMDGKRGKHKKLGYFIPFHPWQWTVAATIDIDDIEIEAQRQQDHIVSVMYNTFKQMEQNSDARAFLFTGQKEILIPPSDPHNPCGLSSDAEASPACAAILDKVMAKAHAKDQTAQYTRQTPDGKTVQMLAFAAYFKSLDWYIVIAAPVENIQKPARALVTRQSYIISALFIISLLIAFFLINRLFAPLNSLSVYAQELPSHDFTTAPDDNAPPSPIASIAQSSQDEIGRLAQSFEFMEVQLRTNIQQLMETTASEERMKSELNVARTIQMGILPKTFPAFPDHREVSLYAMLEPAKEVGGDLYDFFFLDDDHLCFCLGDVSDKGVPAALFMVITRTLVKLLAQKDRTPARMMEHINDTLSTDNPNAMFVTLIVGILNIRTGHLQYSNGGHNPPIFVAKNGNCHYVKKISGLVVGALEEMTYDNLTLQFEPGDALLLYSDGVTEAMNPERELLGEKKLIETTTKLADQPVQDVVRTVMQTTHKHAGTAPQSDDIAIMMLRYNG